MGFSTGNGQLLKLVLWVSKSALNLETNWMLYNFLTRQKPMSFSEKSLNVILLYLRESGKAERLRSLGGMGKIGFHGLLLLFSRNKSIFMSLPKLGSKKAFFSPQRIR